MGSTDRTRELDADIFESVRVPGLASNTEASREPNKILGSTIGVGKGVGAASFRELLTSPTTCTGCTEPSTSAALILAENKEVGLDPVSVIGVFERASVVFGGSC